MMRGKCGHCPLLTEDRDCPGQRNTRVCERADTASPDHAPGILQQIANFAVAATQHVAAGMPMASEEQKIARLTICRACDFFENGGCRLCGCSMDIKAGWKEQSCPIGKWLAISPESSEETR